MPKLILARCDNSPTDELVIVLSQPDNEPAAATPHNSRRDALPCCGGGDRTHHR